MKKESIPTTHQPTLKQDRAAAYFEEGFACAPSVFATYGPPLIDEKTALKIADPFAGGMAMSKTCGAVTGALMVIGLYYGRDRADDAAARDKKLELTKEFLKRFEEQFETVSCKGLLGYDIAVPEEKDVVVEKGLFDSLCPKFIRGAGKILEDLMEKNW